MSIYLGKSDYSPITGYAEIQGDMTDVNSTIWVEEGKIVKADNGYAFCLIAHKISDLYKSDDFKSGTPVCWIAHTSQYTRYTKDNPKLPVEPTPLELLLTQWIENEGKQWLNKSFTGKFHLMGNERIVESVAQSKNWSMFIDGWTECEPSLIKDIAVKGSKGYGSKGYSSQTEAQKFTDRKTEIINASGEYGKDCNDLLQLAFGLSALKKESPDTFEIYMQLLNIVKG